MRSECSIFNLYYLGVSFMGDLFVVCLYTWLVFLMRCLDFLVFGFMFYGTVLGVYGKVIYYCLKIFVFCWKGI